MKVEINKIGRTWKIGGVEVEIGECKECGKEFLKKSVANKFCSPQCVRRWHNRDYRAKHPRPKKPPRTIKCVTCGKEFQTRYPNAKYCSKPCKAYLKMSKTPQLFEGTKKNCGKCGKEFISLSERTIYCPVCRRKSNQVRRVHNHFKKGILVLRGFDLTDESIVKLFQAVLEKIGRDTE